MDPDGRVGRTRLALLGARRRPLRQRRRARLQGIWIDGARRILIGRCAVTNRAGVGIQIKSDTGVPVGQSRLLDSARAGLLDMNDAHSTTFSGSVVSGNGHDGRKYDGDGVEINSSGALVTGNHITGNGDSAGFEHGIYAGSAARDNTIVGNSIEDNAGADIKAAGGPALVNPIASAAASSASSSRTPRGGHGAVQPHPGALQHGVLVTTGRHGPARARFWNNTVEQSGRLTASGDASALFVVSAALLALRNNLLA